VPDLAIFHHTYGFLLRQAVGPAPYPNDFALWVGTELRDRRLAERLAIIDPFGAGSIEDLRSALAATIEDHLRHMPVTPTLGQGEPFVFFQSHNVPVATGHRASTLTEFRDCLAEVDASAFFFHIVEARFRLRRARSDFAEWLAGAAGRPDLADRVERIDPYVGTLERVRDRYLAVLDQALEEDARR